jgi:hypothetical protein
MLSSPAAIEKMIDSTWVRAMHLIWQATGVDWKMEYVERLEMYDERMVDVLHCCAGCEAGMYSGPIYRKDPEANIIPPAFVTFYKLFRNEMSGHLDFDNLLAPWQLREIAKYHFGIGRSLWLIALLIDNKIIRYDQARQMLTELLETNRIGMEIEDYLVHCHILDDVDTSEVDIAIAEVLDSNPQAIKEFRGGKEKALGSIVGQIMKKVRGDPKAINQQVRAAIAALPPA